MWDLGKYLYSGQRSSDGCWRRIDKGDWINEEGDGGGLWKEGGGDKNDIMTSLDRAKTNPNPTLYH